jgi:hypothetical protein
VRSWYEYVERVSRMYGGDFQTLSAEMRAATTARRPQGRWTSSSTCRPGAGSTTAGSAGEGLGRCAKEGNRLSWTIPRLSGGKTTAGPFVAVVDVSDLKPGRFAATVAVAQEGATLQEVTLEKK